MCLAMQVISTVILWVLILIVVIGALCIIRNTWVYNKSLEASEEGYYEELPSYDYMYYHFWVWDINKFRGVKDG